MALLHALTLIIPVLIPSWNFFDVIVASPRIEFALSKQDNAKLSQWREFRPRAERLSIWQVIRRMFWNAKWNESLYLVSCAERLMDYPTNHSKEEIFRRILAEIRLPEQQIGNKFIHFRIVFTWREGNKLREEVRYQSESKLVQGITN